MKFAFQTLRRFAQPVLHSFVLYAADSGDARQMSYALARQNTGIFYGMQRIPSELSDSFALAVERCRKAKGLSRAALAAAAGLHQTYIGLLERGKRSPNLDTAQAIAKSLGCMLSHLIIEAEKIQKRR